MNKVRDFLKFFFDTRALTTDGTNYDLENKFSLFRSSGTFRLTEGTEIKFNKNNKRDAVSLVSFLLKNGVISKNEPGYWKVFTEKWEIETSNGIRYSLENFDSSIMSETFLHEIHYSGNIEGKTVIQAGGFTGDTALYFANEGAKVYSFEPDILSYKIGLKNINLNPHLSDHIVFENYAIGVDGTVAFPYGEFGRGDNSLYGMSYGPTEKIPSKSIKTLLEEFDIHSPYLLDLDIKGSEFSVIEDSSIQKFEKVRIEYSPYLFNNSNANLNYLKRKLDGYGFHNIRVFKHNDGRYDLMNHGTLEAHKNK